MASTNESIVTPRGIAVFPRLSKPDTKFVKEGEYSIKLRLDRNDEEHAAFIAKIEEAHAASIEFGREKLNEALAAAKDGAKKGEIKKKLASLAVAASPFKAVCDEDGNDTSSVEIRFKAKAQFVGRDGDIVKVEIPVRDAKRNAVPKSVRIGGGSEVKVAALMYPYYNAKDNVTGVTFRLRAVQLLKLVQGGGGDFGFDDEEGDTFEAEDEQAANDKAAAEF